MAGVATLGSSLVIGVKASPGSSIAPTASSTFINVNGQSLATSSDPLGQFSVIANYVPSIAGVYTIQVNVLDPFGGPPTTGSNSFRVIGAGGGITTPTPGVPPSVLSDQSYPQNGAIQVPITVNPLIVFSEPVLVPAGSVTLLDPTGSLVAVTVSGVDVGGNAYPDISAASSTTQFTSLTLQPLQSLAFSSQLRGSDGKYQITLSQAIHDPNGLALATGSSPIVFWTLVLQPLFTGNAAFPSPGIFVAQNRAYVAEMSSLSHATVWQFNVDDPSNPTAIASSDGGFIEGRADDVEGEDGNTVAGGKTLIAVSEAPYPIATGVGFQASNVYLYKGTSSVNHGDVDSLTWIGAVSLTQGNTDGVISSITVRGNQLYAATWRKGIQIVDLNQAVTDFNSLINQWGSSRVYYLLNTEGQGFAQDAVIANIPVVGQPDKEYCSQLNNVKVADYTTTNGSTSSTSTLAVATGYVPSATDCVTPAASFVVADVNAQTIVAKLLLGTLIRGQALALGQIQTSSKPLNIAVVVGAQSVPGFALVVVDMSNPAQPKVLSSFQLSDTATDVILSGNTAVVAFASDNCQLFDLTDPVNPRFIGKIQGVGGKLFLTKDGLLYSSGSVPGVPGSPLGGVHVALINGKPPVSIKDVSYYGANCPVPFGTPQVVQASQPVAGAGCFALYNDVAGNANLITNPVWKDSNSPQSNYPVAYVQGQTIKLGLTVAVNIVPSADIPNVTISGHTSGLGDCVASGLTIPAGQSSIPVTCTMSSPLSSNQTKFYNPLTIDWSYSNGIGPSIFIGSTSNPVYVTLAQPLQYTPGYNSSEKYVFRTTLNFAVSVDGATDQASAFSKTWNQFTVGGHGPADVTNWSKQRLYYYRNDTTVSGFSVCSLNETGLLLGLAQDVVNNQMVFTGPSNGSGQCGSFARLLIASLAVNGISSAFARILPNGNPDVAFLVKDWAPPESNPTGPWNLCTNPGDFMVPAQPGGVYCDLKSLNTVYGQNSRPPSEKIFNSHFIVKPAVSGGSTPTYVDPSYGREYANAADFESKAVFGYFDAAHPVGQTSGGSPIYKVTAPIFGSPGITITP